MEPAPASEAIRRIAALWGPVRAPSTDSGTELPSLLRLDPSTGEDGKERLRRVLEALRVPWEGLVEGRAQMRWPSDGRSTRQPPLLVLTGRHAVVFENDAPALTLAALNSLAGARGLTPRAVWVGALPVPDGFERLEPDILVEQA